MTQTTNTTNPSPTTTSKRYRVLPYKQGSKSAKALAAALGGKVLRLQGSTFNPKPHDMIINWGNTSLAEDSGATLNANAEVLRKATNKKLFFLTMKEKGLDELIPQFWTDKNTIPEDAYPVVCRTVLAGHSGEGIVIADDFAGLVDAQLYVKYVKKEEEYRIHVGLVGEETGYPFTEGSPYYDVIAAQKKARRLECTTPNWQIRNHANGFVYKRDGISPPACVIDSAKKALEASGLDFGAVDVIYNKKGKKAYVLEINTAPGLEGQTITDYVLFFKGASPEQALGSPSV